MTVVYCEKTVVKRGTLSFECRIAEKKNGVLFGDLTFVLAYTESDVVTVVIHQLCDTGQKAFLKKVRKLKKVLRKFALTNGRQPKVYGDRAWLNPKNSLATGSIVAQSRRHGLCFFEIADCSAKIRYEAHASDFEMFFNDLRQLISSLDDYEKEFVCLLNQQ